MVDFSPRGRRREVPIRRDVDAEKGPRQEVVRFFLTKSIRPGEISHDAPLGNLDFTRLILIQKGQGATNEGQLMPVGGKINPGETPEQAASGEAVEETHVRPTQGSSRRFLHTQDYEFSHAQKGPQRRRAYFMLGRLLPRDLPYQLNPEEDKIGKFVALSYKDVTELLDHGALVRGDDHYTLLDSLLKSQSERKAKGTTTDQTSVEMIHRELLLRMRLIEAGKKLSVLEELLFRSMSTKKEDVSGPRRHLEQIRALRRDLRQQSIEDSQDLKSKSSKGQSIVHIFRDVAILWKGVLREYHFTHEDVCEALHYSNLTAEIEFSTEGTFDEWSGKGMPTLHLLFPLLLREDPTFGDLRIMAKYPRVSKQDEGESRNNPYFLHLLQLHRGIREYLPQLLRANTDDAAAKIVEAMWHDIEERDARRQKVFSPEADTREIETGEELQDYLVSLGRAVDGFFENLQQQVGVDIDEAALDQINEVKGKPVHEIIRMAYATEDPSPDASLYERRLQRVRRIRWESRRKLLLLFMLHQVRMVRDKIFERGIGPIEAIEGSLEAEDSIPPWRTLELEDDPGNAEASVRFNVIIDQSQKRLDSLLRKVIERDTAVSSSVSWIPTITQDTFRESYVFAAEKNPEQNKKYFTPEEFVVPEGVTILSEDGEQLRRISAPRALYNFFRSVCERGQGRVRIIRFKPLLQGGEGFQSRSSGGGAPIRMAKFYIEHTDEAGDKRYREVQMFFPKQVGETWVSGEEDWRHKKRDDREYAMYRLFITKGLRSFMELLYPAEIYGEIRPIYKGRVTRRNHARKSAEMPALPEKKN